MPSRISLLESTKRKGYSICALGVSDLGLTGGSGFGQQLLLLSCPGIRVSKCTDKAMIIPPLFD